MSQVGSNPQSPVEGRYLLDAALERWGIGEAWQARDKNFRNRPVVLEFLSPEAADLAAGRSQELRAQRALKHPCVLPVINQGVHQGRPWVAFDGFEGAPLARFIEEQRRARAQVDRAVAQDLFGKVLDGVGAAHEAATAVLHGCLSPRSVLVKEGALKVMDFGLGPFATADVIGAWRAPELSKPGDACSIASDVFALGALLADLLMPQNVGDARKALETFLSALARDGAQAGRAQRADVPPGVWDVVARALHRDPPARWDDVPSMRAALDAAWATAPVAAPPAVKPALRAPTMAVPAPARPQPAPAPPLAPLPVAAFSGGLPPVPPPPAAFSGALPFVSPQPPPAAPPAPPPVAPPAWGASPSDAWATLKPTGQSQVKAALASAWDPPAPLPPGPPPASIASAWDAGAHAASWESPSYAPPAPAPVAGAGVTATEDDDWEDETRATSGPHPSQAAIAPAMAAYLSAVKGESTMALDLDSLGAPGAPSAPVVSPVAPATSPADDDWKDSVVVLDTAGARPSSAPVDDLDDAPEPGSRTRVAQPSAPVFDTMETLRPVRRPAAIEAFTPQAPGAGAPFGAMQAPPVSERTMAIDTQGPAMIAQTQQAPMGMHYGAPIAPSAPPQPVVAPPAPASKAPIVVAVVVALLLVAGAVLVVVTRA